MRFFKKFYQINELMNSRNDLINFPIELIHKHVEPALMTSDEYYNFINKYDKWHDENAYDISLDSSNIYTKEDLAKLKLVKQKKIGAINIDFYLETTDSRIRYYKTENSTNSKDLVEYTYDEKKELNLPLYTHNVIAIHREESMLVGSAQDEYQCVLIYTVSEYRGLTIGFELVKIYRELYPSKTSGGFTIYGYKQAMKYHAFLVRKYLRNGIYSDMVKNKHITHERVKEILNSIKDIKRHKDESKNILAKYYGETNDIGVQFDERYIILYDKKILHINKINTGSSVVNDLIFGKVIKAYIGVRWNSEIDNFYDLYNIYSENKTHFIIALKLALSYFKEGISLRYFNTDEHRHQIKEFDWIKELVDKGELSTKTYSLNDYRDEDTFKVIKTNKPLTNIDEIVNNVKKLQKLNDPYEDLLNTVIETSEQKWYEYAEENIRDYRGMLIYNKFKTMFEKDLNYWIKKYPNNILFKQYVKHYFDDEFWKNINNSHKQKYIDKIVDLFIKLKK